MCVYHLRHLATPICSPHQAHLGIWTALFSEFTECFTRCLRPPQLAQAIASPCACTFAAGHKSPEIVALNPRGQVPTFDDNGIVVNESLAILLYLEEAYPSPTLMPGTPGQRAQVLAAAHLLLPAHAVTHRKHACTKRTWLVSVR